MTLTQLINILKAKLSLIGFITFNAVAIGLLLSLVVPKMYKAQTSVIINYKTTDPISGVSIPPQLMPGFMATQADIIGSKNVALAVVNKLKLNTDPLYTANYEGDGPIEDWIAESLLRKLEVTPSRNSNIIDIVFKDKSPELTASVTNAFAEAFIQKSVELNAGPSKNAASFYTSQIGKLKQNLEKANAEFSNFQKENNIVSADGSLDVETARMNDLSQQLVMAQAQLMEAQSRQRSVSSGSIDSPDIASNGAVQSLKAQLTAAEAKLAEIAINFEKNHPEYVAAQTQIDQIKEALNKQIQSTSKTVVGSTSIYAQREREIRAALAQQKQKVLALNEKRNQLKILEQTVKSAQDAYNVASGRYTQSNFEGESNGSNISILSKASTPRNAYFPNLKLNLLLALALGLFFGAAYVIGQELLDRRVRSVEDLESLLKATSYGVYPKYGSTKSVGLKLPFTNVKLLK
jgi:chain length determinant protein EpsF